jgi:uncharacterized protein YbjQ (UPF0145 family)
MKKTLIVLLAAASALAALPAAAADRWSQLDVETAIAAGRAEGVLDGSVSFHFRGAATPRVQERRGAASTSRRTNGVGKSDEEACRWVMLSALKALQDAAKERGANAVVDLVSMTKNVEFASPTQYRCASGNIMSAVALQGEYARVAGR